LKNAARTASALGLDGVRGTIFKQLGGKKKKKLDEGAAVTNVRTFRGLTAEKTKKKQSNQLRE